MSDLTHFNEAGEAYMVDVSQKSETTRIARAQCLVHMNAKAFAALKNGQSQKGDVLGTARLAGIMGAKQTAHLIPLCHPLPIKKAQIDFEILDNQSVKVMALVKTQGQTGVEMEALMAANIAALTIYDMLKAVDKSMIITELCLLEKIGGKSGHYQKAPE